MKIINILQNQSFKLRAFIYNQMSILPTAKDSIIQKVSIASKSAYGISTVTYGDVVSIQNDQPILVARIIK